LSRTVFFALVSLRIAVFVADRVGMSVTDFFAVVATDFIAVVIAVPLPPRRSTATKVV
jgi:hypothetical protein